MSDQYEVKGHAFISYAREDSRAADQLQGMLQAAGVPIWRDADSLWPGQDWRTRIRQAITENAIVFIACFSERSTSRQASYQNEELMLAIEQLRLRGLEQSWLIPVRFDDCIIPDWEIGAGRTLNSLQRVDLFGDSRPEGIGRLLTAVLRILYRNYPAADPARLRDVPANTDRWRLTHAARDVPAISDLGSHAFGHQAYARTAERTPPWVRTRAAVACGALGESPGWQVLRNEFLGLLMRDPVIDLIGELSELKADARWRPRGTSRRSRLEADLATESGALAPIASASLVLPEAREPGRPGPDFASLSLHIDFARRRPLTLSGQRSYKRPRYWRARFAQALALPGELDSWLKQRIGLETSGSAAAQCGVMLRNMTPLTDLVDTKGITALSAPAAENQFTGWVVADINGKAIPELASLMMLDLAERLLHLDGTVEQMSGDD